MTIDAKQTDATTRPALKPCPFCGGEVDLEQPVSGKGWGVICRNTINLGGTCAIEQSPSVSKEAAIARWNLRAIIDRPKTQSLKPVIHAAFETEDSGITGWQSVPVKRVAENDDGSFTAVIDYWPEPQPIERQRPDSVEELHRLLDAMEAAGFTQSERNNERFRKAARRLLDSSDDALSLSEVHDFFSSIGSKSVSKQPIAIQIDNLSVLIEKGKK